MTKPKPLDFRAKKGRKTNKMKKQQNTLLKMLFDAGDVTPFDASCYAKCGYEYALKQYIWFTANLLPFEIVARIRIKRKIGYTTKF